MNAFAISGALTFLISLAFGFLVLFKSQNKALGRIWFVFALWVALWGASCIWIALAKDPQNALYAWRCAGVFGVIGVTPLFFHFVCIFCQLNRPRAIRIHYLISLVFLAFAPTWLFIGGVRWVFDSFFYLVPGPLYFLYPIGYVISLIYSHLLILRSYETSSPKKRIQIKYLLLSTCVGFSSGASLYFPVFGWDVYPWGNFGVCLYPIIMSYAILRHSFMDVHVFIQKTAVYSVVTGALTGIYLLIATQLAKVLEGFGGHAGFWSSAIAAAAITVLFHPLLNKVRSFMDERIFGDWLRDMSRGVVHEVKRPLASISMPAQLTLMELEDVESGQVSLKEFLPTLKDRLKLIVQKAHEAGERIEALYALSESSGEKHQAVNVREILQSSVNNFRAGLEENAISVTLEVSQNLPPVKGDARQLEIVFINLIKNATEAMSSTPQPRRLTLRASEDGRFVVVGVRDSGPGMSPTDREHVFDAHFTTKGSKGMGLGLYLTDKIVREHGGSLDVQSEENKGTEFIVRLPKLKTESEAA